MMNRLLVIATVLLAMLCLAPDASAASDTDRLELDDAYNRYKELVADESYTDALPHAQRALELGEGIFGEVSAETATLAYNYGALLLRLRNDEQAVSALQKALAGYEALHGEASSELIPVLIALGRASTDPDGSRDAVRFLKRALKLQKVALGENTSEYGEAQVKVGVILMNGGALREAKTFLRSGHKRLNSTLGDSHPLTGYAAFQLGRMEMGANHHKRARDYFLSALQSFQVPDSPSNQLELTTHAFLVQIFEELNQSEQATEHCLAIGRMSPFDANQDYLPLYKKPPSYPMSALAGGQEGSVIVEFTVDESGFVREPFVASLDGSKVFKKPALEAVEQFRYAPRFVDGKPVPTTGVQNRISFKFAD